MRWLERHSYEDWMNDMATDDSQPAQVGSHAGLGPNATKQEN